MTVKQWKHIIDKYGATCESALLPGFVRDFTSEDLFEYDIEVYDAIFETMEAKGWTFATLQEIAETIDEDDMFRLGLAIMELQRIHIDVSEDIQSDIYPDQVAHFEYCGSILPSIFARPTKDENYWATTMIPSVEDEEQALVLLDSFKIMEELWLFDKNRYLKKDENGFFEDFYKLLGRETPHISFSLEYSQSEIEFYESLKKIDEEDDSEEEQWQHQSEQN